MSEEIKVPCGGFSIGTGLSLAGGVLSADSSGGGIMSFETMREYLEYCEEHGVTIAYVTKQIADNPYSTYADDFDETVYFPVLCLGYFQTMEAIPDAVVPFNYGLCIDSKGFAIMSALTCNIVIGYRKYSSIEILDEHFEGKNVFGEFNPIKSLMYNYGLIDYNMIEGYYLESEEANITTLKSYDGKKTATITSLSSPDEDGYEYTITITDNTSTGS